MLAQQMEVGRAAEITLNGTASCRRDLLPRSRAQRQYKPGSKVKEVPDSSFR